MSQLMISVCSITVVLFLIGLVTLMVWAMGERTKRECAGGQRNFKVRFNPGNSKYYVTNATSYGDIDIRKYIFFRVYYKSKIDADFVMQKMNN